MWRGRLNDARLRLDFAHKYVKEVERDFPSGEIPENERQFSYQHGLRAESLALAEYRRILRIFTDLVTNGMIPDESEWLKVHATRASGGASE
jgi:hypothetical protein